MDVEQRLTRLEEKLDHTAELVASVGAKAVAIERLCVGLAASVQCLVDAQERETKTSRGQCPDCGSTTLQRCEAGTVGMAALLRCRVCTFRQRRM